MHRKMAEIAAQCMKAVTPRCTYRVSEIAWENGMPSLFGGQLVLPGRTAAVMLRSCSYAALLVCTLGATFDALARQVQARDFADALLLDGFGGAYVEAGCNAAEREIAAKLPGKYLTDRFSPGYGDFSIEHQRDFSRLLDTPRKIGLTVTESCLLAPIKSVTAVIGLSPEQQDCHRKGCEECSKTDCEFRRS